MDWEFGELNFFPPWNEFKDYDTLQSLREVAEMVVFIN